MTSMANMPTLCTGIDEAGLGPLLGPLGIVAASAWVDEPAAGLSMSMSMPMSKVLARAFRRARTGVKDSKQIHQPGDLAPIERMALAAVNWLTGCVPATAAKMFELLGEDAAMRAALPWMRGAEDIALPVAAEKIPAWKIPGVRPCRLGGRLVQPESFNQAVDQGVNKADLELGVIAELLRQLPDGGARDTVVDRLGGRRYYADFLQRTWPAAAVCVDQERPAVSGYRLRHVDGEHLISFCVDGESVSPLTAIASCIAKYGRELHMMMLNRYWTGMSGIKPTAGYTRDARRWIDQLGAAHIRLHGDTLVRRHLLDDRESDDGEDGEPPLDVVLATQRL